MCPAKLGSSLRARHDQIRISADCSCRAPAQAPYQIFCFAPGNGIQRPREHNGLREKWPLLTRRRGSQLQPAIATELNHLTCSCTLEEIDNASGNQGANARRVTHLAEIR